MLCFAISIDAVGQIETTLTGDLLPLVSQSN
jgi:hypothetical protein